MDARHAMTNQSVDTDSQLKEIHDFMKSGRIENISHKLEMLIDEGKNLLVVDSLDFLFLNTEPTYQTDFLTACKDVIHLLSEFPHNERTRSLLRKASLRYPRFDRFKILANMNMHDAIVNEIMDLDMSKMIHFTLILPGAHKDIIGERIALQLFTDQKYNEVFQFLQGTLSRDIVLEKVSLAIAEGLVVEPHNEALRILAKKVSEYHSSGCIQEVDQILKE